MAPKKKESTQDKQQSVSSKKQTRKIDPVKIEVDKNITEIKSIDDLVDKNQKIFIKHLVECNCVLPQYKDMDPTIFHKFIVFSEIKKDGSVKQSYIKCNSLLYLVGWRHSSHICSQQRQRIYSREAVSCWSQHTFAGPSKHTVTFCL